MTEFLAELQMVDGHCHTVLSGPVSAAEFELGVTEADRPPPAGVSTVDGPLGLAVRRWCAPVLDLPAHSPVADYLDRRAELGPAEVRRRLLDAAGLSVLLVDTGLTGDGLCSTDELLVPVREVVRLEWLAEATAARGVTAADFAGAYVDALHAATADAVAVKSIAAYRHGLDLDPARPTAREVTAATGSWLATGGRLTDPVLLRFLLWCGVDTGLPVQLHTGFGDRDLALHRANPTLLQPFLAAAEPSGVPVVLLHCYPFHRQAGWLAQVYPHVYADVGLTVGHTGAGARRVLGEFCELAPFGKLLFSTDAYLLPELYLVGAAQFRHSMGALLDGWLREDALSGADALRIAAAVAADNARRVYRLGGETGRWRHGPGR